MIAKKFTSFVLVVTLLLSSFISVSASEQAYVDVSKHWAENEILKWSAKGLLQGNNGQFSPDENITRAEMAVILDRLMNYQNTADNTFSDLDDSWYKDAVLKNIRAGIMLGFDGRIRPKDFITRQETVVMLSRALNIDEAEGNTSFFDDSNIANWAKGFVKAFSDKGYVKGMPDGTFAPDQNITRASVVKMIDNIVGEWITVKSTVSKNINGTLIINTPDVIVKDAVIGSDLIVGAGVGEGEVTIENTEIAGELIINGGGENSVKLKGRTKVKGVVMKKEGDAVRIVADKGITVPEIKVKGETKVIIDGEAEFTELDIKGAKKIEIKPDSKIKKLIVEAGTVVIDNNGSVDIVIVEKKANNITLNGNGKIENVEVDSKNAKVAVGENAVVNEVKVTAKDVTLENAGTISKVTVGQDGESAKIEGTGVLADILVEANDVEVNTKGTNVSVGDEAEGVTAGGKQLEPGVTTKTDGEATTGDNSLIQPEESSTGNSGNTGNTANLDREAPVITIDNTKITSITASTTGIEPDWTTYFTVNDNVDGEITVASDMISENVDMRIGGVYTITLTVTDNAGNKATQTIEFIIEETVEMLGLGTWEDPYLVSSIEDLCTIGQGTGFSSFNGDNKDYSVASYYKLIRDLDFTDLNSYQNPNDNTKDWDGNGQVGTSILQDLTANDAVAPTNRGFVPIGYYGYVNGSLFDINKDSTPFIGTFDGSGYEIHNLFINAVNDDIRGRKGFFGYISTGAVIKNTGLVNVNVIGNGRVGGLVGHSTAGIIENSFVTGEVTGEMYVGGLVGYNENASISKSYAAVDVKGDEGVGGLVGGNESDVTNCYATGNVMGIDYVGGLIGENYGTLKNSYATGHVIALEDGNEPFIGGLAGMFDGDSIDDSIAFNSYISGDMNNVNRIAGYVDSGSMNSNYSYAEMLVDGVKVPDQSIDNNDGTNISSEQFIDITFLSSSTNFAASWNFFNVWEIKADAVRPTLKDIGTDSGQAMRSSNTQDAQAPTLVFEEAEIIVPQGESFDLSVTASVEDGGTLSYKWYFKRENDTYFNSLGYVNTASFTKTEMSLGIYEYLVKVTNTREGYNTRANYASIKVIVASTEDAQTPYFTTDLDDSSPVSYGMNVTPIDLTISALVSDGGSLSYQWYEIIDVAGNPTEVLIDGEVNQIFTPPTNVLGTFNYFCKVTNTNNAILLGQKTASSTSRTVAIVVEPLVHAESPSISMDINEGDGQNEYTYAYGNMPEGLVLNTNAVTDGGDLTFEWFVAQQQDLSDAQSLGAGTPSIPGPGSILFPNTDVLGTFYYYCDVTNTNNSVNGNKTTTIRSAVVSVTITNNAPTVTLSTTAGIATPQSNNGLIAAVPYVDEYLNMFFYDIDGNPLTYSIVSAQDEAGNDVSTDIFIDNTLATITYTPSQTQAGKVVTIVVKANDGLVDSVENLTITITVGAIPNTKPRLVDPGFPYAESTLLEAGQLYSLDLNNLFTDDDGDALTYTIVQEDFDGAVVINDNMLEITPTINDTANQSNFTVMVKANDGVMESDSLTINLWIKEDYTGTLCFEPLILNVPAGIADTDLSFPSAIFINHGSSSTYYPLSSNGWISTDYDNTQYGRYTFKQSFTLPENVSNSTNLATEVVVTVNVAIMGGDGLSEYTPFEIRTVEDLCLIGRGTVAGDGNDYSLTASYKLMGDLDIILDSSYADPNGLDIFNIDANPATTTLKAALTTSGPGCYGFLPIAYGGSVFKGTFDGGNNSIKNLYIGHGDGDFVGLFAYTNNAKIKNLGLENLSVNGNSYVGGLIGYSEVSQIENCFTSGNMSGTGQYIGGMIGRSLQNSVRNSYSEVVVSASSADYVGGLVGYTASSSIYSNYTTGSVFGHNYVGGLVGYDEGNTIKYTYTTGTVSGNDYVSGLVGFLDWSSGRTVQNSIVFNDIITCTGSNTSRVLEATDLTNLFNNYANASMTVNASTISTGTATNKDGQNITSSDLQSQSFFTNSGNWFGPTGWDFTNTWEMKPGALRPTLKGVGVDNGATLRN